MEKPRQNPQWEILSQAIYLHLINSRDSMCNKPNHPDLFFRGVNNLSSHPSYITMSIPDRSKCIQSLGLRFGIDCKTSIKFAQTILSQREAVYNRKWLEL